LKARQIHVLPVAVERTQRADTTENGNMEVFHVKFINKFLIPQNPSRINMNIKIYLSLHGEFTYKIYGTVFCFLRMLWNICLK
jgi:hypothetical protein